MKRTALITPLGRRGIRRIRALGAQVNHGNR